MEQETYSVKNLSKNFPNGFILTDTQIDADGLAKTDGYGHIASFTNGVIVTGVRPINEELVQFVLENGGTTYINIKGSLKCRKVTIEEYYSNNPKGRQLAAALEFTSRNLRLSIGTDPEVFVEDDEGIIPAFQFLPSAQDAIAQYHGKTYWDGFQAEFTTPANVTCQDSLVHFIRAGLNSVLNAARKVKPAARLSINTVIETPIEQLKDEQEEHVVFGCRPSLNVYGDSPIKLDGAAVPFRMSGGHIHMGINTAKRENIPVVIKELDRILGVISVPLFSYYEDSRRRSLYGRAGEYRETPYGFEYRVLSSAWLIHPAMVHFVYEVARRCLGAIRHGPNKAWDITEEEARKCINECDADLARSLLERNIDALRGLISTMPGCNHPEAIIKMIFNGVHTCLRKPDEFSHVWNVPVDSSADSYTKAGWTRLRDTIPKLAKYGFLD